MGAGSSTDKAVGNVVNTVTQGASTVVKDQVSERQDYFQHPLTMILPTVIGVICVIVSIVIISQAAMKCDLDETGRMNCTGGSSYSDIVFVIGILMIITVQIVLAVRHPRAAAEMEVGSEIKQIFS